jgi:DNA-binding Lrp family transcriptional regulator
LLDAGRDAPLSVLAFVLLNVKVGTDRETVERLKALKGVRNCWEVYAVYDVILLAEVETMAELDELVNSDIRKIETVTSTHTIIAEKFS